MNYALKMIYYFQIYSYSLRNVIYNTFEFSKVYIIIVGPRLLYRVSNT